MKLVLALFPVMVFFALSTGDTEAAVCFVDVDPASGSATVRVCSGVQDDGEIEDGTGGGGTNNPPPIYCSANDARVLARVEIIVYEVSCVADLGGGSLVDIPTTPVFEDLGSAIDLVALVDEATAQVEPRPPNVETSPPVGRTAVVHIPVWVWLTDAWEPVSASATASIPLVTATVEVTATPVRLTVDPGAGDPVACTDAGVEWEPGLDDEATDCLVTYLTTLDAPHDATATVDWLLTWSLNGVDRGPFTTRAPSTTWEIPVTEIQALEQ